MGITFETRIETGRDLLDQDLRDLQIVSGAGGAYLYAATGSAGGISAWQLFDDGRAASVSDWVYYPASAGLGVGLMGGAGAGRLWLAGLGSGEIAGYDLEADGELGALVTHDLPGGAGAVSALTATVLADGQAVVFAVVDGVLAAYGPDVDGALEARATVGGAAAYTLSGRVEMVVAGAGSGSFLLAGDAGVQGVRAWRIGADGALSATDSLGAADGVGISTPTALETVTAFGATWVILAAAGSSSLSVMRLEADGSLSPADHLLDTRETRFGGAQALAVVEADGHVFVIAGGADDGLSLFTLLPDGHLVHLHSLAHDTGLGLENVTAIEAVHLGNEIQVFVTSGTVAGLSQFSLPLDDLGQVIRASGSSAAALTGTGGDDLVLAGTATGTLAGGAGDDVLVSGQGGAVLSGGAGADVFVLGPGAGTLRITDFDPAEDRLDLSQFPMLRSTAQLTVQTTAWGARVLHDARTIVIETADGTPLVADDLWPGGALGGPDRVLVLATVPGLRLQGTIRGEYLAGGAGDDTVHAGGGADRVWTGAGADLVAGGGGRDRIGLGDGNDTAWGGDGADVLIGGGGADVLGGGDGWDRIWAGPGDDRLDGGTGNDQLGGGAGADTILAGGGDDRVYGGDGSDQMEGGWGRDMLWGGGARDTLEGGAGNDTLGGGDDRDFIWGGPGDDVIVGGTGNDSLTGGDGADLIWAGHGNDVVYGSAGDDTLGGGIGRDALYGGAGRDDLRGATGDDRLCGEAGDDTLTGGAGADVFEFRAGHGADVIADFSPGEDLLRLDLAGLSHDTLDIRAQGGGTVIGTGAGTITLWGVLPAELTEEDFVFG